jgi:Flp pilus assembly protein CpaB
MSKQKMMTLSVLAALCVLASVTMHAKAADQEARKGQERQDRQEGMVVVRDAQTGKMRAPTPEELKALRAKAPPSSASVTGAPQAPQQLSRRDGARGVRLGEKSLVYDVVTRGEDGKLSSQCVQGEAAAREALEHPANAEHKEHNHEAR